MSDTPLGPATRVADVEVNGRRIVYVYTPPNWLQEGPGSGPFGEDDEIPGDTTDGEPMCIDVSAMSDEDKLKTLIRFAAAVELEKIKAQPNQNREYGVFFYIENNQVRSTQILQTATHRANLDWQGLPRDSNGAIDWTRVVGFMHSHPCINLDEYDTTEVPYGDSSDPFRLMRPSPRRPGPLPPGSSGNPPIIGDWVAWDYYVNEGANPNSLDHDHCGVRWNRSEIKRVQNRRLQLFI